MKTHQVAPAKAALTQLLNAVPAPQRVAMTSQASIIQQLLDWIASAQDLLTRTQALIPNPAPDVQTLRDEITALLS
jgi:hypothetical protein